MYYAVHGSLPRKHILDTCGSYTGASTLRHFVIRHRTGIDAQTLSTVLLCAARAARVVFIDYLYLKSKIKYGKGKISVT